MPFKVNNKGIEAGLHFMQPLFIFSPTKAWLMAGVSFENENIVPCLSRYLFAAIVFKINSTIHSGKCKQLHVL